MSQTQSQCSRVDMRVSWPAGSFNKRATRGCGGELGQQQIKAIRPLGCSVVVVVVTMCRVWDVSKRSFYLSNANPRETMSSETETGGCWMLSWCSMIMITRELATPSLALPLCIIYGSNIATSRLLALLARDLMDEFIWLTRRRLN